MTARAKTSPAKAQADPRSAAQQAAPAPAPAREMDDPLRALLRFEVAIRKLRSEAELRYFAANELRLATRAQQTFLLECPRNAAPFVSTVSSLTAFERRSPVIRGMEDTLNALIADGSYKAPRAFVAEAQGGGPGAKVPAGYPLRHILWCPLVDLEGRVFAGLMQTRTMPWSEHDIAIARHLTDAIAIAWRALNPRVATQRRWALPSWKLLAATLAAIAALGMYPVSMSALAPVEVASRHSAVVTSGLDGVVQAVEVAPNAPVKAGDVVVRLADTELRNRVEVTRREVAVAEASLMRWTQLAFSDERGRHEVPLARAQLNLKVAEHSMARDLHARSVIRAPRDGWALYADVKELVGKPVAAGDKLMEIVEPETIEFRIDLPAHDAIVLAPNAPVRIYLDSDPLNPIEAVLRTADYQARVQGSQQLAFRIVADPLPGNARKIRLGVRGTAQVLSEKTNLAFYLLRRPLTTFRQMTGL